MSLTVRFTVDDDAVLRGLREQRRQMSQDVKRLSLEAGERTTLPVARSMTKPTRAKALVTVKSTTRGAYLTTNGPRKMSRIVGLLNFGGTVTTPIVPRGRALKIGPDTFVAHVTGPRRYKGQGFLDRAVDLTLGRFSAHFEKQLARVMQSRLTHARTFS